MVVWDARDLKRIFRQSLASRCFIWNKGWKNLCPLIQYQKDGGHYHLRIALLAQQMVRGRSQPEILHARRQAAIGAQRQDFLAGTVQHGSGGCTDKTPLRD